MSDDRFKAVVARLCAMNEIEMGSDEGQALLGEFMSLAPPELQAEMRAKFQELCPPLPEPPGAAPAARSCGPTNSLPTTWASPWSRCASVSRNCVSVVWRACSAGQIPIR